MVTNQIPNRNSKRALDQYFKEILLLVLSPMIIVMIYVLSDGHFSTFSYSKASPNNCFIFASSKQFLSMINMFSFMNLRNFVNGLTGWVDYGIDRSVSIDTKLTIADSDTNIDSDVDEKIIHQGP